MNLAGALVRREVVARGPLQLRLRSEYRLGSGSRLIQDMVFHAGTPRVDFDSRLEWAERRQLLKAVFDLDVLVENARHEIQYGHLARFEVCCHKWSDLSENGFGVALLNDCKYGISAHAGRLGLTLLKSGVHPDPRGDEGTHLFTYSLLPHAGGFSVESVVRPAYELNQGPTVCLATPAATAIDSLATVDAPSVVVECVKWAEEGHALVLRLYEAGKTGCRCRVRFGVPVRAVAQTNLLEEETAPVQLRGNMVEMVMRAFEVTTLRAEV
jgi:alpha-mannosidase